MQKKSIHCRRETLNGIAEHARSQMQLAADLLNQSEFTLATIISRQAWLIIVFVTHRRLFDSVDTKGMTLKTSTDLVRSLASNGKLTLEQREAVMFADRVCVMGPESPTDIPTVIETAIAWLDETEPADVAKRRQRMSMKAKEATKPSRLALWRVAAITFIAAWLKGGVAR